MIAKLPKPLPLFHEIKTLIDSARQRAAVAVNAELTLLYWQVGQRNLANMVLFSESFSDQLNFARTECKIELVTFHPAGLAQLNDTTNNATWNNGGTEPNFYSPALYRYFQGRRIK